MEDYSLQVPCHFSRLRYRSSNPVLALSALRAAVIRQHKEVVRELLLPEYRLPVSKLKFLATLIAAAKADVELLSMLVDVMEDKIIPNFPRLIARMVRLAVENGRRDVVQMLSYEYNIGFHSDPDDCTIDYQAPLYWAARSGRTDMMPFILGLELGTQFNKYEEYNETIQAATARGHEAAVKMLLDLGADPALALWSAVWYNQPRITKLVLDRYPDLLDWERGQEGRMMLWRAVKRRNLRNIKLLVDHGVSLNDGYEDSSQIPINAAKDGSGQWVVDYLLSLGAQDTDSDLVWEGIFVEIDSIPIDEHTWQWVSRH